MDENTLKQVINELMLKKQAQDAYVWQAGNSPSLSTAIASSKSEAYADCIAILSNYL